MIPTLPSDGVLVVDKPEGPTSHDVVSSVRRLLGERRVGHAGTLDPFATGVLVCCVGRATRLARFLAASDKTYEGVITFGFATDTGDRTGRPLAPPVGGVPTIERLREASGRLTGEIAQVPPMYSAKKIGGVPLYDLARRGEEVERAAVLVRVRDWLLGEPVGDRVAFRVTCSAGTYVRVLASSLGDAVGCPAHLAELRRVSSGAFGLDRAHRIDDLDRESARAAMIPMRDVPLPLRDAVLRDAAACDAFGHGRCLDRDAWDATGEASGGDEQVAVRDAAGDLLGMARCEGGTLLHPTTVLTAS